MARATASKAARLVLAHAHARHEHGQSLRAAVGIAAALEADKVVRQESLQQGGQEFVGVAVGQQVVLEELKVDEWSVQEVSDGCLFVPSYLPQLRSQVSAREGEVVVVNPYALRTSLTPHELVEGRLAELPVRCPVLLEILR
jgi:hypothetical protein